MRAISSSRGRRALLGGEQQRPVLDERVGVEQVGEVLARRAPAALAALRDRLRPCRVEPDLVTLAHRPQVLPLAVRPLRLDARASCAPLPAPGASVSSSWPSSTASPTATATARDDAVALREHLVLHLHRLQHHQRAAGADVLVELVGDRHDDARERGRHLVLAGRCHRQIIAYHPRDVLPGA